MIEVKMARFYGDNNKPDDTSLKDFYHRPVLTGVGLTRLVDTVPLRSVMFCQAGSHAGVS